jgi:repressor LexA
LTLTPKARKLLKQLGGFQKASDNILERLPFAGVIAAGEPIEAVENKKFMSVKSFFGPDEGLFALEVRGDSMIDAGINSGDYAICRRASTAADGQIVVALLDDENATLKRFYRQNDAVRLQPANSDYEPIYSNNCLIQGVVIGLLRKL